MAVLVSLADYERVSALASTPPESRAERFLREVDALKEELGGGVDDFSLEPLEKLLDDGSIVHAFDEPESLLAAKLEADARRSGRTADLRDLFIVATARTASLSVATRNVGHFRGYGVIVFDPFTGEESL